MKEVALTRGKVAWIDDADAELIAPHKWRAVKHPHTWYAQTNARIHGKMTGILMHRLILAAKPGEKVDHRDHNGLNNQRENLRIATTAQNAMNRLIRKGSTKGVLKRKAGWEAWISIGRKKRQYLGLFPTEQAAKDAYDRAAEAFYGEFASGNEY